MKSLSELFIPHFNISSIISAPFPPQSFRQSQISRSRRTLSQSLRFKVHFFKSNFVLLPFSVLWSFAGCMLPSFPSDSGSCYGFMYLQFICNSQIIFLMFLKICFVIWKIEWLVFIFLGFPSWIISSLVEWYKGFHQTETCSSWLILLLGFFSPDIRQWVFDGEIKSAHEYI